MGSYFFMRVAWARRRRAATLMKKYEPMVSCLMVFWGGIVITRDYAKLIDFYGGIYGVMDFYEGIYTFMDFYEGRGRK